MTIEPDESREDAARRFDDVASLFGSIVPPPGSRVRPARPRLQPLPTELPEPTTPPVVPLPPERPELVLAAAEGEPKPPVLLAPTAPPAPVITAMPAPPPAAPLRPQPQVEPRPAARPRPTEIPWPDAFEPRPNFKKPQPRNWSWLLLVPIGILGAYALSVADMRAVKTWLDANVLHRTPVPAAANSPLLPAPFRTDASPAAPAAPAPEPAAPAAAPIPYPELPTSPVPVPAGTEVSPPPPDPAADPATVPPSTAPHVTIQFRRNTPGAEGEARRIAALLQNIGGSVELRPAAATTRAPTITYYAATDKPAATALAIALANEAASWTLRLGAKGPPAGTLDVSMP